LPAHAIPQGNGDCAFGIMLPDDVLIELSHDLARSEFV
jgi:hypothetical protein